MARDFDRIHKSVRWPYTYDNTDYSWRTRLTVRPQDFHSWNSSSILLCATNKKLKWKKSNIPYPQGFEFVRKYFETDASYCTDFNFFRNLRGSETDRNSRNMDVQKSFEDNLNIVGFDSHTRY